MSREIFLNSLQDTASLARKIGIALQPGQSISLKGDLGTGKTEFVRALIRSLMGEAETVPSPTFTLVQTYETPKGTLWHCDFYRLESPEEAVELGLEEALANDMVVMEWPEKLGPRFFRGNLTLSFFLESNGQNRRVMLQGNGPWVDFLETMD